MILYGDGGGPGTTCDYSLAKGMLCLQKSPRLSLWHLQLRLRRIPGDLMAVRVHNIQLDEPRVSFYATYILSDSLPIL